MTKNSLYFAANFEPEVARMHRALEGGEMQKYVVFKMQTVKTVERVLASEDISAAGKEEWSTILRMVERFEFLGAEKNTVLSYGVPFSRKFAQQM